MVWTFFYKMRTWQRFSEQGNHSINLALSQAIPGPDVVYVFRWGLHGLNRTRYKVDLQFMCVHDGDSQIIRRIKGNWDGDEAKPFIWTELLRCRFVRYNEVDLRSWQVNEWVFQTQDGEPETESVWPRLSLTREEMADIDAERQRLAFAGLGRFTRQLRFCDLDAGELAYICFDAQEPWSSVPGRQPRPSARWSPVVAQSASSFSFQAMAVERVWLPVSPLGDMTRNRAGMHCIALPDIPRHDFDAVLGEWVVSGSQPSSSVVVGPEPPAVVLRVRQAVEEEDDDDLQQWFENDLAELRFRDQTFVDDQEMQGDRTYLFSPGNQHEPETDETEISRPNENGSR